MIKRSERERKRKSESEREGGRMTNLNYDHISFNTFNLHANVYCSNQIENVHKFYGNFSYSFRPFEERNQMEIFSVCMQLLTNGFSFEMWRSICIFHVSIVH